MKEKDKKIDIEKLTGIIALFIHVAKIDDNYDEKEKIIIKDFLKSFSKNEQVINDILQKSENLEKNSNQLLNFTNVIKKNSLESKSIIIKELWKIILSDDLTDEYESNMMRRICGLIYFPDKLSGEIKMKLLQDKNKL
jgi:uncharacterized tellurite resistance protein B-like protein|tara:strand:+ start:578 stop:991 length:414 start_codon:yes stop_codon:yes gene_type:complete